MGQQRDQAQLGEGPGVRAADDGIHSGGLELRSHDIRLRLPVDEDRRPDDIDIAAGQLDLGGEVLGDHLDDVDTAFAGSGINTRVTRGADPNRRDLRCGFVDIG